MFKVISLDPWFVLFALGVWSAIFFGVILVMHRSLISEKRASEAEQQTANSKIRGLEQKVSTLVIENATLSHKCEQAEKLAAEDPLTGALNRRLYDTRVDAEVARCERQSQASFMVAVIYIDFIKFKEINDNYGHLAGDEVLVHSVRAIKDVLRKEDDIYRMGGDEFTIVAYVSDDDGAQTLAAKIAAAVKGQIFSFELRNLTMSASVGYALLEKGDTKDALLYRADAAQYRSKEDVEHRIFCR